MKLKIRTIAAMAIVAFALAGCMTEEKYEAATTALQGSGSLRAKTIERCVGKPGHWSKTTVEAAALVMDVPESRAPSLACQRTVNAMASGRLTYQDMEKLRRGDITAKMVKIMQGR